MLVDYSCTSSIYLALPGQYSGGGCLVMVVVVVADPVSQWWWSDSPRVFLVKIPFFGFF